MNKTHLIKLIFILLSIIQFSCTEEEGEVPTPNDDTQEEKFTGTKIYSSSGSGQGTLVVSDSCQFVFTSKTDSLILELNYVDDVITSGNYTLNISTHGSLIDAENNCLLKNFDETIQDVLTIDGNNLTFTTAIGESVSLQNVNYAFDGLLGEDNIVAEIDHSSLSLVATIEYVMTMSKQ